MPIFGFNTYYGGKEGRNTYPTFSSDYTIKVGDPVTFDKINQSTKILSDTIHKTSNENQKLKNTNKTLEEKNNYLIDKNIRIEALLLEALKLIEKSCEEDRDVQSLIKRIEPLLIEEEENES